MTNSQMGTIETWLADCEHGTYDFTKNGKCSCCGGCCSNLLPMSQREKNQVHQYIEKHNIKPITHFPLVLSRKAIDMQCPFLDLTKKTAKCTIYEVRPMICREYVCNKWDKKDVMKLAMKIKEPHPLTNMRLEFYPETIIW